MYHLGIDLGGTNIAAGVVDEKYNIVGRGKKKTNCPRPADEICDELLAKGIILEDTREGVKWKRA